MLTRRSFLRGEINTQGGSLRPPWALIETDFLEVCTRCDACHQACPENIITPNSGYPVVDFNNGECTFCGDCAIACGSGALSFDVHSAPWFYRAVIKTHCLALQGVVCQSCQDECESMAIRFQLRSALIPEPVINMQTCTGCGACVKSCPASAIAIKEIEADLIAHKEPA